MRVRRSSHLALAGLLACLSIVGSAQNQSLEMRAQQYWARRQAKDLTGAYPFYCSAYRARVPLPQFLQLTRLVRFDLSEVRVAEAAVTGNRADVSVVYKFVAPMVSAQTLDGRAKETWIRDTDGQWCKEDEPIALPFPPGAQGPPPAGGPR